MERLSFEQFTQIIKPEDLKTGSIFGALSDDATRFLLEQGKIWQVAANEPIFEYGERGDCFYVICSGSVDFYKQHKGVRSHIRTAEFGEEVGFVSMIALHDNLGRAVAREDSILLEVEAALFQQLHQEYSLDFGLLTLNLARDLARVITRLGDKLVDCSPPELRQ